MASCQLYIELCEGNIYTPAIFYKFLISDHISIAVRRKVNVKYHYSAELNQIYLTVGNENNDAIDSFYLAIPSNKTLDLTSTKPIQTALHHAHEIREPENVPVNLAIVDSSTTIAFYKLTLGMSNLRTMKNKKQRATEEVQTI